LLQLLSAEVELVEVVEVDTDVLPLLHIAMEAAVVVADQEEHRLQHNIHIFPEQHSLYHMVVVVRLIMEDDTHSVPIMMEQVVIPELEGGQLHLHTGQIHQLQVLAEPAAALELLLDITPVLLKKNMVLEVQEAPLAALLVEVVEIQMAVLEVRQQI
jgi:hypothetical protein